MREMVFKKIIFTAAVISVACTFYFLGNWQLERAAYKKELIQNLTRPVSKTDIQAFQRQSVHELRRYEVSGGEWKNSYFYIDNQFENGLIGKRQYGIYCLEKRCLLVRGPWITNFKESITLNQLPLIGQVRRLPYSLIKANEKAIQLPITLVNIDKDYLERHFEVKLLGYELVLDAFNQNKHQVSSVSVHRHYGYALQFYLLALIVIIGYILAK
ncbi:MAG: hypothetical protein CMF41_03400 [Legionellales bacterium]|nr:hypothetical protein [Legionellales bacterium]OUX65332.1 MAG: hypothetical protein CBE41_01815 [Gammaproteobacteria bacterium TMED281]